MTSQCDGGASGERISAAPAAQRLLATESDRLGLPVADPMRGGAMFDRLVDACLA